LSQFTVHKNVYTANEQQALSVTRVYFLQHTVLSLNASSVTLV